LFQQALALIRDRPEQKARNRIGLESCFALAWQAGTPKAIPQVMVIAIPCDIKSHHSNTFSKSERLIKSPGVIMIYCGVAHKVSLFSSYKLYMNPLDKWSLKESVKASFWFYKITDFLGRGY